MYIQGVPKTFGQTISAIIKACLEKSNPDMCTKLWQLICPFKLAALDFFCPKAKVIVKKIEKISSDWKKKLNFFK